MDFCVTSVLLMTFACCFWNVEARNYTSIIYVTNGGQWGTWGTPEFCSTGYANGFALKVQDFQGQELLADDTSLNGIRLHCSNGDKPTSKSGPWGYWTKPTYCPKGNLIAFVLNVQESRGFFLDDTAADNIKFYCDGGTTLIGKAYEHGLYGEWSEVCSVGAICGIQSRIEDKHGGADMTALNDVKFFCCA